jgi:hypothetical protein
MLQTLQMGEMRKCSIFWFTTSCFVRSLVLTLGSLLGQGVGIVDGWVKIHGAYILQRGCFSGNGQSSCGNGKTAMFSSCSRKSASSITASWRGYYKAELKKS